jgi:hypothetical protein
MSTCLLLADLNELAVQSTCREWARPRPPGAHLAALWFSISPKGQQMIRKDEVREKMEVVGSDGKHVGTVDHCEDGRIKLARNDPAARGQHHYVDLSDVDRVDGNRVCLQEPADEVMQRWQAA